MPDERIAIDADGHVLESDELFTEYLDPVYRARTSGWALNEDNNRRFIVDGVCHPPHPREISSRKPMTAENRIKVLDKERIQAAILFPSATTIATYLDPGFADAMVRAHNAWIADYVKPFPDRLFFAAPVAIHDVDAAIAEARRAVDELGAVAILTRPNPTRGRTLDCPEYDPFYATVQELGVPLILHESTGCEETAGGDRYGGMMDPPSYAYNHIISHAFEQMFGAMSIIAGGVLERFPSLRVGFFEAGCSWAPYWLARLDDHYRHPKLGPYLGGLTMKPSEYFDRQCFVTCDPGDHTIPLGIQGIGAHKIMFATDYPHFDSSGSAVRGFLAVDGISEDDRRAILWDNAARFFDLNLAR
jgi:uncharacterized protein